MTPTTLAAHHYREARKAADTIAVLRPSGRRCAGEERSMRFHAKAALKVIELAGSPPRRHEAHGLALILEAKGW